ncbi:glycosyl hydrolase family 95 catalytic domain-containing protein [Carboxylicivirga marina]|uniref:glycosyl hydrolase family 95 catalytic domain-containing protein n=1 Tax=Carboxylicivirga marina TaxID=2800988 RepID=UPI002591B3FC|nr:hypothetical protein [uncultured Carboxylicivirga sp.]
MKIITKAIVCTLVAIMLSCSADSKDSYSDYVNRFNLKWNSLPQVWHEAAFLGNGRVGTTIWGDTKQGIRFDIGDARIYKKGSRVPVGKFVLHTNDSISAFTMQQSAGLSEVKGQIKTKSENYSFETFADINEDIVRIRFKHSEAHQPVIEHVPLPGIQSNKLFKILRPFISELELADKVDFTHPVLYKHIYNTELVKTLPDEEIGEHEGISFRKVPFSDEVGYILLWHIEQSRQETTLSYSTVYYRSEKEGDVVTAINEFKAMLSRLFEEAKVAHQTEWNNYFNESFISIPDKRIEANYWFQIYKMRAATCEGELPIDLLGPWFRATPWPRIWTNLNVQITYPTMNQANKKGIASTLFDHMDTNQQHFINAVPKEYRDNGASIGRGWAPYDGTSFWGEYGNFLWLLYNYSQFLEHFPDEARQAEKYYPLLKRGVNFVLENLIKDKDGIYHVPADISPEYKVNGEVPEIEDNSYNIGLLNWALKEVIYLSEKYSDNASERAKYSKVLNNLVPLYVDDETGIMLGKDYKMDVCHRHFSHLLAFYPLAVLDVSNEDEHELCRQSLERWITRPHSDWGFKGYTYTAATAMYARLGDAEKALESLNRYLDDFATYNTFYIETGPVIETPMHSASVTLELLLQSYKLDYEQDEIKLFPALPAEWEEASFSRLRSEGGFIVSASYANKALEGACIESVQERRLRIVLPVKQDINWKTSANSSFELQHENNKTVLSGNLKKGEVLWIGESDSHSDYVKIIATEKTTSFYGIN